MACLTFESVSRRTQLCLHCRSSSLYTAGTAPCKTINQIMYCYDLQSTKYHAIYKIVIAHIKFDSNLSSNYIFLFKKNDFKIAKHAIYFYNPWNYSFFLKFMYDFVNLFMSNNPPADKKQSMQFSSGFILYFPPKYSALMNLQRIHATVLQFKGKSFKNWIL